MRKKHDEGYALIFVLVVMVVLSLISISLMTAALRNLQNQKTTVAQMTAKYEAQGEMEKLIASYVDRLENPETTIEKGPYNNYDGTEGVKANAERLLGLASPNWLNKTDIQISMQTESESTENGYYRIDCTVIFRNVITGDGPYYIARPAIEYEAYTVTRIDPADDAAPAETPEGGAAE